MKINNLQKKEKERFNKINVKNFEANKSKVIIDSWYNMLSVNIVKIQAPFIFILSSFLYAQGFISIGSIYVTINYSNKITRAFTDLAEILEFLNLCIASYKRLDNLLNLTLEDEKTEKAIYWTQGTFKDKLPKPKAQVIKKDYIDNKKSFSFVACGLTKDDYDSYVDKCKKMGYTVDADNFDDSYYAKNSEGYKIDIRYDADDFELNVSISAPRTNNENQNTTDTTDDDQEIDEED